MNWLTQALATPPSVLAVVSNQRECGVSPTYSVMKEWAINIYTMRGELIAPGLGRSFPFRRGDMVLLPAGLKRRFEFHEPGRHMVVMFSFTAVAGIPAVSDPIFFRDRAVSKRISLVFDELKANHSRMNKPRADSLFWEMLWRMSDVPAGEDMKPLHPALEKASAYINDNLNSNLIATEVAKHSGISHNQLNRLFHGRYGCSIMGYLWRQRMRQIENLLRLTDIPIKAIAAESGMSDLQQFNKAFRRHYGCSPRAYRSG
ncbi:MAG: helix-turn-helix transcriptional regulator [Planctomycetes bacterium]|nr:helix-turn-helix transcriptional regulator [Planctomycetota bacterium]